MTHKRTNKILYEKERTWFFAATALLFGMALCYIYVVSATVLHVVMRKEVDTEMAQLNSHLSELESSYIEAQHSVSADIAGMKGFVVAHDKVFIDRAKSALVLNGN